MNTEFVILCWDARRRRNVELLLQLKCFLQLHLRAALLIVYLLLECVERLLVLLEDLFRLLRLNNCRICHLLTELEVNRPALLPDQKRFRNSEWRGLRFLRRLLLEVLRVLFLRLRERLRRTEVVFADI